MFAKIKSFFIYILYFDQKKPTLYRWLRLFFVVFVLLSLSSIDEMMITAEDNAVSRAHAHTEDIGDELQIQIDEIANFLERR